MKNELVVAPDSIEEFMAWLPKSDFHSRETTFRNYSARGIEAYIIMGAILFTAREKEDWKKAQCNNFREWVENEQRVSHTQAIRMMTIWDKLQRVILKHFDKIKKISFVNLYEVARIADNLTETKLIDLLEVAAENTERHFKDNIREIEGKATTDSCDHVNMEIWFRCKRCQKYIKTQYSMTEEEFKKRMEAKVEGPWGDH